MHRLETFLDVGYALLLLEALQALPTFEDIDPTKSGFSMFQIFRERPTDVLRLIIGIRLVLGNWGSSHDFTGPLVRSARPHANLVLMQFLCVCFFIYFAIADPALRGGPSSTVLQSVALLLAGVFGLSGFRYAGKHGLIDAAFSQQDRQEIRLGGWVEPITAALQIGTAFINPLVWTLGWLVIPIPVRWVLTKRGRATQSGTPTPGAGGVSARAHEHGG